jgi:2-dehydropantoate 2-reductase
MGAGINHVDWPRIAVVGAGAVGGYFGGMLARAGASVVMIGREPFVAAVQKNGLLLDTLSFKETVGVEASTEISAAHGADIVLFCVKTTDTADTARALAPFIGSDTRVLSLQNGVDNIARIRTAADIDALPAVVYVAVSVPEPGCIRHVGRGDLIIGPETAQTRPLAELFVRAGVPCRITDNIDGELWIKLLANCALNALSALGQAKYGRIADDADARALMRTIVGEVLAVARAARVVLPGIEDTDAGINDAMNIARQMTQQLSSTAQDLRRGKRTEIDSLNGFIARRGSELGVAVPVNHALFTLVRLAEDPSVKP